MMEAPYTMSFEEFWIWVCEHYNCILRAGTPDSIYYDSEQFHWHFASESEGMLPVQLLMGKLLVGEFYVERNTVDYVQFVPSENEREYTFELISEADGEQFPAYIFVMAHAYELDEGSPRGRIH